MNEKAYLENVVHYDSNNNFLSTIRHEALYAAYILSRNKLNKSEKPIFKIDSLNDLQEDINLFNNNLYSPVKLKNELFTYGICLLNKWCGFESVQINEEIKKGQIQKLSRIIYEYFNNKSKLFYDSIYELEKKLMFFITLTNNIPSVSLFEMISLTDENTYSLIQKIPAGNAYIAHTIINALIDRCVDNFSDDLTLCKLFKSGSRFNKTQLARSCITIGLVADEKNIVHQDPIRASLIEGLTEEEFFRSSPGTRKSLIDKDKSVPNSGYMERTLVMSLSPIEISEEDCHCSTGLQIKILNKNHLQTLKDKWYSESNLEDPNKWKILNGTEDNLIGSYIQIRSPMTCQTKNFKICKKCYGERPTRTPYVGITAGQSITERLTQLLLRTFHVSGSANIEINKNLSNFIKEYLTDIIESDNKEFFTLIFSNDKIPKEFSEIEGYYGTDKNQVIFNKIKHEIKNDDALATVENIKEILRKNDKVVMKPGQYYEMLVDCILSVGGEIYSSLIEIILTHIFMTGETEFWRYNQDKPITIKLSEKTVASKISPLLGFLYQPNRLSISGIEEKHIINQIAEPNDESLSMHEKIFLQKF